MTKTLKANKHRLRLNSGTELQFHRPLEKIEPLNLQKKILEHFGSSDISLPISQKIDLAKIPLEVEIGCGKGELIARRAAEYPDRIFIGIDRRKDRFTLTQKKVSLGINRNCLILREDARSFLAGGLPTLNVLHVYHPDPWPKDRHHKHRFFRSPDALEWALAITPGGELRLSSDHRDYFFEILEIVSTWKLFEPAFVCKKEAHHSPPKSYFESIFLRKNEPVFKAHFFKKNIILSPSEANQLRQSLYSA